MKKRTQNIATQPRRGRARFAKAFKLEAVRLLELGASCATHP